jgi:uncharacterized protein YbaP (TraB family)
MILIRTACIALVALSACACGPTAEKQPAASPDAEAPASRPAMWKTGDEDTTVYFLGTVHVLPPDLKWRTPEIDRALGEAKAIYFETDIEPDLSAMASVVMEAGMYPVGQTLSDRLKPDDRAALAAAAEKLGMSMIQLDRMRPWLAATTLADLAIAKAGYDPGSGVERKLFPDARAANKDIRKLETVAEQLHAFADLPEAVQIDFLMQGVRELGEESDTLDGMIKAWAAGDIDRLNEIMIEGDLGEMPEVYGGLLVNRNARWVPQLDQLIKSEPGTFLIAVGAAHLIGKDSVLEMLKPFGYVIERVE